MVLGQPFVVSIGISALQFHHKCNDDQYDQGGRNRYFISIVIIMGTLKISKRGAFRMIDKIRIACATDDGKELTSEHFGSARIYMMYEMDPQSGMVTFIERIENTSEEEKEHGDPNKARSVSEIIKDSHVLLCRAMGKNLTRMQKNYSPAISSETDIEKALELLTDKLDILSIEVEKEKGTDRNIIRI